MMMTALMRRAPTPAYHLARLESALRQAFPHFQNDEPITPEAIDAIGREYMALVSDPGVQEITFVDHDGEEKKVIYDEGDRSVGIYGGWVAA